MDKEVRRLIRIPVEGAILEGDLEMPSEATSLVLFAHGSGSSRHSPRNRFVSLELIDSGLATLLIDLLTEEEDLVYEARFDIDLLARRLTAITRWLERNPETRDLQIGYFGASTGAAAALKAAATMGDSVKAVVSRGGRPDLADEALPIVKAPVLLIVGGHDDVVLGLNQRAYDELTCVKDLQIVPGATHLFEEPGALEEVARLSRNWFVLHMDAAWLAYSVG